MDMPLVHIATSADALAAVLKSSRVGFEVQRVPSQEAPDWGIQEGALQHSSGGSTRARSQQAKLVCG